jgi:hypothetical protein
MSRDREGAVVEVSCMKLLVFTLLFIASLVAAPGKQTFTGVVTDSMCSNGNHSNMRMGPTDAECTKACVSIHGASYVLYDGKNIYTLSDQKAPEKFAGKKVAVTGTLDAKTKTIQVDSITAAK